MSVGGVVSVAGGDWMLEGYAWLIASADVDFIDDARVNETPGLAAAACGPIDANVVTVEVNDLCHGS